MLRREKQGGDLRPCAPVSRRDAVDGRTLAINEKLLGPEHPRVADVLGHLQAMQQRYREAVSLIRRCDRDPAASCSIGGCRGLGEQRAGAEGGAAANCWSCLYCVRCCSGRAAGKAAVRRGIQGGSTGAGDSGGGDGPDGGAVRSRKRHSRQAGAAARGSGAALAGAGSGLRITVENGVERLLFIAAQALNQQERADFSSLQQPGLTTRGRGAAGVAPGGPTLLDVLDEAGAPVLRAERMPPPVNLVATRFHNHLRSPSKKNPQLR
jgi:hypothetical protein